MDGQIPTILELRAKQHLLDLRVRRKYEKSYMVLYTTDKSALLSLLHTHIHSLNSGFPTIQGNFGLLKRRGIFIYAYYCAKFVHYIIIRALL